MGSLVVCFADDIGRVVVNSIFDNVVVWVVVLAWVVEVVATLIEVPVDVFGFSNNVGALVVKEA